MRKLLIAIVALLLIITGAVFLFIPTNITVISETATLSSIGSVQSVMGISSYRTKWLPKGGKILSPTTYILDGCTYIFGADNSMNDNITIQYKNINVNSLFTLITAGSDSVIVNWRFSQQSGNNPLNKAFYYFNLKHIKETNEKILVGMQDFLINKKNVYGFDVKNEKQADSTLITMKAFSTHYPTVDEIYTNIEKLKQYAVAKNANTTNAPMLNIRNEGSGKWMYMVALPIDKALDNKGEIIAKRMFAGGKILITDNINGGFITIDKALENLEKYKNDYSFMSPAIPFQSLVTDRTIQQDTSKWTTRLYYPVY